MLVCILSKKVSSQKGSLLRAGLIDWHSRRGVKEEEGVGRRTEVGSHCGAVMQEKEAAGFVRAVGKTLVGCS